MATILADCKSIINSRTLTYMSEKQCVKPTSTDMFLKIFMSMVYKTLMQSKIISLEDLNIGKNCKKILEIDFDKNISDFLSYDQMGADSNVQWF